MPVEIDPAKNKQLVFTKNEIDMLRRETTRIFCKADDSEGPGGFSLRQMAQEYPMLVSLYKISGGN